MRLNYVLSWWRYQVETFSALLALCKGDPPVTGGYPHKGQWREALTFSLICAWTNGWANNRDAGDLRRHHVHYGVTVMMRTTRALVPEENQSYSRWSFSHHPPLLFGRSPLNTLRPRQNGRRFADNILNCIFVNTNMWIWTKMSLKFIFLHVSVLSTICHHWFR